MDLSSVDILGGSISLIILAICNLVFVFRLLGQDKVEYWLGILLLFTAIPLIYLLFSANHFGRAPIYYIQVGTMIGYLLIELLLDYVYKIEFRKVKWMAITYAMIFFGGTGGMIGIASQAGATWMILSIVLFLIMASLAFYQRAKTGM